MAHQHAQGAASAAPILSIARDFLAIGGRIMVNPEGAVECAINPTLILGRTVGRRDRQKRRGSLRAMVQAERRHAAALASLVVANGAERGNGWQVWEAGR